MILILREKTSFAKILVREPIRLGSSGVSSFVDTTLSFNIHLSYFSKYLILKVVHEKKTWVVFFFQLFGV